MSTSIRNIIEKFIYTKLIKNVLFLFDPELVHDTISTIGKLLSKTAIGRGITRSLFFYKNPKLEQTILGISFKNPIGLAAGFDKNAELTDILPHVGFGFEEVGSITGKPCLGNPKPRLWRLKESQSLLVYYGLKNDGSARIAQRLSHKTFAFPVGISIAKTNDQETITTEQGIQDYCKAYKAFEHIGAYYTINISCPNTYGGEPFTDPTRLELLLKEISLLKKTKPIFLKLPAELPFHVIDKIIEISKTYAIDGFIATNLAKNRNTPFLKNSGIPETGGMSGKVVQKLSDDLIAYLYKKTKGSFIIIGCGGIFTAEDAYKKIKLGASLVQLITGMVYEGPQVVSTINRQLVTLLEKDGYNSIREAIGKNNN